MKTIYALITLAILTSCVIPLDPQVYYEGRWMSVHDKERIQAEEKATLTVRVGE